MTQKQQIGKILEILDENYLNNSEIFLDHENPWQLLVATILSAQCTDARVNMVTKDLFARYKNAGEMAKADKEELQEIIRSTGFYKNKAKNLINCCKRLETEYGGEVPSDIDELVTLAGVGRKTANVIRGNIFKIPSVVVDTHVKRISIRWGLTLKTDPEAIEKDLMEKLPEEYWIRYNTQVIAHGRNICRARSPRCEECMFIPYCPHGLGLLQENLPQEAKEAKNNGHMY